MEKETIKANPYIDVKCLNEMGSFAIARELSPICRTIAPEFWRDDEVEWVKKSIAKAKQENPHIQTEDIEPIIFEIKTERQHQIVGVLPIKHIDKQ